MLVELERQKLEDKKLAEETRTTSKPSSAYTDRQVHAVAWVLPVHPVPMDTSAQQVRWAGTATMEARALLAAWDAAGGLAPKANQGLKGNRAPQGSKEREDRLD